ncbi:MAG: hypothetical protein J6J33_00190 [Clostridia bacterium]|nr:hypothetical protein [Clostridia bacterium]
MEKLTDIFLLSRAEQYLKINPDRFTTAEKNKFRAGLAEWIAGTSETIDDEVYDFLLSLKIDNRKPREEIFASHITQKYKNIQFRKILDVGAGRMCKLSNVLTKYGYKMYAIDPNIRLSPQEASKQKISSISKKLFLCDDFAPGGKGTNVQNYDLIVGLEPCDATEHIIRQAIKYNKPFEVLLCAAEHPALDGTTFKSYLEWYEHLKSISTEVKITQKNKSFIASNINEREF